MAFGNASLPIRKYVYGVREYLPRSRGGDGPRQRFAGHDLAIDQLHKAHRFQNELVRIELDRRAALDDALHQTFPDLLRLRESVCRAEAEVEELEVRLKAINLQEGRKVTRGEVPDALREARARLRAARAEHKDVRSRAFADEGVAAKLDEAERHSADRRRLARAAAVAGGLYWATANHVDTRVKRSGRPPRFKRFTGEGLLAVQFLRKPDKSTEKVAVLDADGNPRLHPRTGKPMTRHVGGKPFGITQAMAGSTLLRVRPDPDQPRYATIDLRIASDAESNPLWVSLPTVLHRPIPADGEVKFAYLSRRMIGTKPKWEVQFDVAKPAWEPTVVRPAGGCVAVALGWRWIDGDLRVGRWVGDDGREGDIVIPAERLGRWKYCDGLQGTRDSLFNRQRDTLVAWMTGRVVPEAFAERAARLAQWRSADRLARLVAWWRSNRFDGDEAIFRELEGDYDHATRRYTGGRLQDKHLYDWQQHQKLNCRDWRKHYFRHVAIELARSYRTVAVAEINWAELGQDPDLENQDPLVNKTNKGIAAVAQMRDELTTRMDAVEIDPHNIVSDCHRCGNRCQPPGAGRWVVCERCGGEREDRARNAAKNLLQRALQHQSQDTAARVA